MAKGDMIARLSNGASTWLGVGSNGQVLTADSAQTLGVKWAAGAAGSMDGWVDDTANTWTYASASTFTVSGDRTSVFKKGTYLRFTQTTVKYGVVASSSHAAGTTTVTIIVNTDYVLANAAISLNYYSYEANPQGYPGWFNFAASVTGFSSTTTVISKFSVVGKTCFINVVFEGTSNATSLGFTLPVATLQAFAQNYMGGFAYDNGASQTTPAQVLLPSAGTAVATSKTTTAAWTNSGAKKIHASFNYEF